LAVWRNGELHRQRYWHLPGPEAARRNHAPAESREAFVRQLRSQLEDSVAAHRLADVPVGTFLSGGLDSAVTTGLMARAGGDRLKTFSIGFEESEYSELGAAEATAKHLGTDHHAIILTGAEAQEQLGAYLASLDQPTGDGFNTWLVSRAARQGGVTAALSGLGGDELFGGYPSFRNSPRIARWLPWWRSLPRFLREPFCRRLDQGDTGRRKLAGILRQAANLHDVANRQREVFGEDVRRELLGNDSVDQSTAHPAAAELREAMADAGELSVVSAWEMRTYMHDVLLRDSDVFSMRASLELRVPLVDRPLIEWLAAQPDAFRFDPRFPKGALHDAVADMLPPGLRDRPKRGFTLPFPRWMRGPMREFIEDTLTSNHLRESGWLHADRVMERWIQFRDGGDDKQWSRVWSLVVLAHFLRGGANS
jgi:asparagine synthase (glutamine-hydrolysing)